MGDLAEDIFEIEECPFCKSENLKAVMKRYNIFHKKGLDCWEDEEIIGSEEINFFCEDCKKEIEIDEI